jgi:hypothetical protein
MVSARALSKSGPLTPNLGHFGGHSDVDAKEPGRDISSVKAASRGVL